MKVLGSLGAGHPTNLENSRARPSLLAVAAVGSRLIHSFLWSIISLLFLLSVGDSPI